MKRPLFDFSDTFRAFRVIVAHLTLLLSALVITFFIIDRFNTAMEFIESEISKWVIAALGFTALANAVLTIVANWVNPDGKRKKSKDKELQE